MHYGVVPRAVFSHPQIASVGLGEAEAKESHETLAGTTGYDGVSYGIALVEQTGLTKAVVDADSEEILGFHIIGPHAAILIQEVINVMIARSTPSKLRWAMHIHSALSELMLTRLGNLTS